MNGEISKEKLAELMGLPYGLTGDRLLVMQDASEQKIGSIIIPDTAQEKPKLGTVIAKGPGTLREDGNTYDAIHVDVGSKVVFGKYAGSDIKINGVELILVRETDIFMSFPADAPIKVETIIN